MASRAVTDLTALVFPAGWQIPIRAFPLDGATISRAIARIDEAEVRFLSLRGGPPDWVGPAYLYLTCHVPTEARYHVSLEALLGPEQGQVQLFQDEVPVGPAVDLYSAAQVRSPQIPLGQLQLEAGDNPIMLKLVGQNPQAKALGLDLIQVRLVRVP